MEHNAIFDELRQYRYLLSRSWDVGKPKLLFIMLNPSTADGNPPDETIGKCITITAQLGFGSLEVVNLYSYISTDPNELANVPNPIGEETDCFIFKAATRANKILLGWGYKYSQYGLPGNRAKDVITMLRKEKYQLYCLRKNSDGCPIHPLGLKDSEIKNLTSLLPFQL